MSRKSLGQRERDHCHGDSVYSQTTGHSFLSAIDGTSWLAICNPRGGHAYGPAAVKAGTSARDRVGVRWSWSKTPEMGMMTTAVATKL